MKYLVQQNTAKELWNAERLDQSQKKENYSSFSTLQTNWSQT